MSSLCSACCPLQLLGGGWSGWGVSPGLSQVSPVEKNTSETLYSLKFAERVRSVELGPGSRRAELGSWSSQEHLEVRGPPRACLGRGQEGRSGSGTAWSGGKRKMPEGAEPELEPKPSSLFSSSISSWSLRSLWGRLLVGCAGRHTGTR